MAEKRRGAGNFEKDVQAALKEAKDLRQSEGREAEKERQEQLKAAEKQMQPGGEKA